MFSNIMKNATKFKEKISQEIGDRMSLSENYGGLWEPSENVQNCRGCGSKFQLPSLLRKHHCRICAGVFCDSCCILPADSVSTLFVGSLNKSTTTKQPTNGKQTGSTEETSLSSMRICDGCKRCEVPGEGLRKAMRMQVEAVKTGVVPAPKRRESRMEKEKRLEEESSTSNALERLSMMVAVRVGENVGVQFAETQPSEQVHLTRGSAYGEDGNPILTEKELPRKGYFELNNKSKEFCCVKVLRKGGDQRFEVPRPSYLAVPPGGSVHAFFNEDEVKDDDSNNLEVIILFNNPNKIPNSDTRINFDTTLIASSKKLTPCAKVELFKNVTYYEVASKNRNVFLKYKGDGRADVRVGNSMRRVGLIGAIKGNRYANDILDFSTNVHAIESVFTVAS